MKILQWTMEISRWTMKIFAVDYGNFTIRFCADFVPSYPQVINNYSFLCRVIHKLSTITKRQQGVNDRTTTRKSLFDRLDTNAAPVVARSY